MKKTVILLICLLCLCSCSEKEKIDSDENVDIDNNTSNDVEIVSYKELDLKTVEDFFVDGSSIKEASDKYNTFATNLFKTNSQEGKNGLLSPFSLYAALSVLANGAVDSDKAQTKLLLENVLGMSVNDLNKFYKFVSDNSDAYGNEIYRLVNGLWFNTDKGISLDNNFINTIKEYYGDAVKEGSFSNKSSLINEVNNWASIQTNGSINSIVDYSDINEETIFLLLNALTSDAEWEYQFDADKIVLQNFYNADNSKSNVNMMKETLNGYWHDEYAEGFTKELLNGTTFVAILPNEGVDINEYIKNMDENTVNNIINSYVHLDNIDEENRLADFHYTNLSFPKFKYSLTNELDETLKKLGLNSLYDLNKCDFSMFGSDLIYVQKVKQKDTVDVNEKKVSMSAVTLVAGGWGATGGYKVRNEIYHDVTFDRPFLYFLIEDVCDNHDFGNYGTIILFAGVVNELENTASISIEEDKIGGIGILADAIKIRTAPTTKKDNQIGVLKKNEQVAVYEIKENEGYTWYRIGKDAWVADDGTWIMYCPGSSCGQM